jgi:hypothetical protein
LADIVKDAGFAQSVFNLDVGVFPKRIEIPPQSVIKKEWRLGNAGELLSEFGHIHFEGVLSVDEILRLD